MNLDSVRELKQSLTANVLAPLMTGASTAVHTFALGAGPLQRLAAPLPSLAIGISHKKGKQFQLAVRCQREELLESREIEQLRQRAKNEIDVRFVGRLRKRAAAWNQKKVRPLQIGLSCGHFSITAGTLGCFVRKRGTTSGLYILSDNHVLANENAARAGDAILQQGAFDGGAKSTHRVAGFTKTVKLKKSAVNLVDAAIAEITPALASSADLTTIQGLGTLAGLGPSFVDEGTQVAKLGRTTELTRGRVTAFELDNVVVGFDLGNLRFDDQIEIEGAGTQAFSAGGDSGSVIVTEESQVAIGLLFAGGDIGGSNGKGLTYANPIHTVLELLKVDLALQ